MTSRDAIAEETKLLQEAEHLRKQKAARMPQLRGPDIPDDCEQHAQQVFSKITEKLKILPLPAANEAELKTKIADLQRHWNAPERHLQRSRNGELQGGEWAEKLTQLKPKLGTGFLFAFVGIRGPGKTQMAVELMRHQTEQRIKSAKFAESIELFCALREPYGEGSTKRELKAIEEWIRPELLVIDEAQERAETPWEDRLLTFILNKRYNANKDTILIANLKEQELLKSLGNSVHSRLIETGGIVEFNWESFRK